jgi:hypothetical protein
MTMFLYIFLIMGQLEWCASRTNTCTLMISWMFSNKCKVNSTNSSCICRHASRAPCSLTYLRVSKSMQCRLQEQANLHGRLTVNLTMLFKANILALVWLICLLQDFWMISKRQIWEFNHWHHNTVELKGWSTLVRYCNGVT